MTAIAEEQQAEEQVEGVVDREMTTEERGREILRRAMLRLSRRGGWTSGREMMGRGISPVADWQVDNEWWQVDNVIAVPEEELPLLQNGAFCAIGAINYEARLLGATCHERKFAERLLGNVINRELSPVDAIIEYNDCSRSKTRVVNKFRKALGLH